MSFTQFYYKRDHRMISDLNIRPVNLDNFIYLVYNTFQPILYNLKVYSMFVSEY